MKINELRIGNDATEKGRTVEIVGMFGDRVHCKYADGFIGSIYFNSIEPIPLTEELLLGCGFNKDYKKGYIGIDCCGSDFVMTYPRVLGEWQRHFVFQFETGGVPKYEEIKYIHQLQNLFFCLSGEELEVHNVS